jgi:Flp pilus assembly protein TadG
MQTSRIASCGKQRLISRLCRGMKDDKGGALVELAFTVPILALLLLGVAEIAQVEYVSIEVSDAAMAGVQYGATNPSTAADTTGIQTAAQNDSPDITLGTTNVSHSCICSNGSASTCQPTDCQGSNIETILTVQTQTTVDPLLSVPGLPTQYTLYGQATQKVWQ